MASTGHPTGAAAFDSRMSASSRNAGAAPLAYPASAVPPICALNAARPSATTTSAGRTRRPAPGPGEPAHREIRHRHHQRQRVARRHGFLEEQIEDEIRHEGRGKRDERRARRAEHADRADDRERDDDDRDERDRPGRDELAVQRRGELVRRRRRPQHLDAGQILGALIEHRVPVGARAAGQRDERNAPGEPAEHERRGGPERRPRACANRLARDRQHDQRHGEPRDLRSQAGRERRRESSRSPPRPESSPPA